MYEQRGPEVVLSQCMTHRFYYIVTLYIYIKVFIYIYIEIFTFNVSFACECITYEFNYCLLV